MVKVVKKALLAVATGVLTGAVGPASLGNQTVEAKSNIQKTASMPRVSDANMFSSERDENTDSLTIVNIGDSRTVGMFFSENNQKYSKVIDVQDSNGNYWFAKVGQGLEWFEQNINNILRLVQEGDVVVINLGVNDLASSHSSQEVAARYINRLNLLAKDWTAQGKYVFFSASNPVGPQYRGANMFNRKIDSFNQCMQNGLSENVTFIDTNTYIKGKLKAKDFDKFGLHYGAHINRQIHQYIESQVSKKLAQANSCFNLLTAMRQNGGNSY